MPLKKGTSKKVFEENISEMMKSKKHHTISQAVAAAFAMKRKSQGK